MSGLPPITLLVADALSLAGLYPPQWGVFSQDGLPILVSESVASVEYKREYDVSKYPQEPSGFQSYNKVQVPYGAKVTILSGQTRQVLLSILEPVVASLQLVAVVMPEWSYPSANLTSYGFRRTTQGGVSLIAVDLGVEEIRYGNSMLAAANSSTPQQQAIGGGSGGGVGSGGGGTDRPVGQVSGGLGTGGGAANVPTTTPAVDTGSTNGAYPTQSGPVQPASPGGAPSTATPPGLSIAPESEQFVTPSSPPTAATNPSQFVTPQPPPPSAFGPGGAPLPPPL